MFIRSSLISMMVILPMTTTAYAQPETDMKTLQHQCDVLLRQGHYDEALALNDKALSISAATGFGTLWFNRAMILQIANRQDEALQAFDKALTFDTNFLTLLAKGTTLNRMKRYSEAIETYNQALKINPTSAAAVASRGAAEAESNQEEAAMNDYEKAIKLDPKSFNAYASRGALELKRHEYVEAKADLDKANELDPNEAGILATRAAVLWGLKNKPAALADAQKAAELRPGYRALLEKMQRFDISHPLDYKEEVSSGTVKKDR